MKEGRYLKGMYMYIRKVCKRGVYVRKEGRYVRGMYI